MKIAFQGEMGAYSEEAVRAFFPTATPAPTTSFEAVFEAVTGREVDYAVVPIENSLFGSVHVNYDLLRAYDVEIIGELSLRIRHCLMAVPGSTLGTLREVHSHPQALGQCQAFLREQLPHARAISSYDTAGAAKRVAETGRPGIAAIASRGAAEKYALEVLAESIESNHQNYTRFLVLRRTGTTADTTITSNSTPALQKTSIVFSLRENVPGALFKSLAVFALRDLDLFKVESRPLVGRPGNYLFYLDVAGAVTDEPVQRALAHLQELTATLKILGSYPRGVVVE